MSKRTEDKARQKFADKMRDAAAKAKAAKADAAAAKVKKPADK
jgi:hypothetical protein